MPVSHEECLEFPKNTRAVVDDLCPDIDKSLKRRRSACLKEIEVSDEVFLRLQEIYTPLGWSVSRGGTRSRICVSPLKTLGTGKKTQ